MKVSHLGLAVLSIGALLGAQDLKFAELGDFKLENGDWIRDCRVGYPTFGELAADKSNAIVFLTGAGGTTEQAETLVGDGKLLDSTKHYVILIDPLANGVSSSPSNSRLQPRMQFPRITVADMVNSQHELLTRVLRLEHVKAVLGQSMGGMQTFQWMVSYPDFMDKAIPIVGTPRPTSYDLVLYGAVIEAIKRDLAWNGGDYTTEPARRLRSAIAALTFETPQAVIQQVPREQVEQALEQFGPLADANDQIRQYEAGMAFDISCPFGNSMERAAAEVKAKVLVIVASQDHAANPGPALEFARMLRADTLVLDSECGHVVTVCEAEKIAVRVAEFLFSPPSTIAPPPKK
jgi:homoserine O-acetyltransferase